MLAPPPQIRAPKDAEAVPPHAGEAASQPGTLRIAVGIATSGRPAILAETLADLAHQTLQPTQVLVLYGKSEDVGDLPTLYPAYVFAAATGGLCEKRNRILDATADADLLFFMDDDFYLDPGYLQVMERAFREDSHMVAASGRVLADGAKGPGLSPAEARAALADGEKGSGQRGVNPPEPSFNTYGCNMAFRLSTIRRHSLRFDEQLPAYGWYEDIDFSRRIARFGSMMLLRDACGVHLGAKVGRVSGRKLGYSQVANPVYLAQKGSFPWDHALRSIGRNCLANLVRSLTPESYVDRRGRLIGNLLAFRDLLQRRMHPTRILAMR